MASDETPAYHDPEFADELGRTIRLMRIDRRMERRDLAAEAGISYSYLSAIENGSKTPSARLLYTLARALGVRDDELLAVVRERLAIEAGTAPAPLAPSRPAVAAPLPQAAPAAYAADSSARGGQSQPAVRRRLLGRRSRATEAGSGPDASSAADRVRELDEILGELSPDDADAVIDLARRLAGK